MSFTAKNKIVKHSQVSQNMQLTLDMFIAKFNVCIYHSNFVTCHQLGHIWSVCWI